MPPKLRMDWGPGQEPLWDHDAGGALLRRAVVVDSGDARYVVQLDAKPVRAPARDLPVALLLGQARKQDRNRGQGQGRLAAQHSYYIREVACLLKLIVLYVRERGCVQEHTLGRIYLVVVLRGGNVGFNAGVVVGQGLEQRPER